VPPKYSLKPVAGFSSTWPGVGGYGTNGQPLENDVVADQPKETLLAGESKWSDQ
jgi:hypothetical protein